MNVRYFILCCLVLVSVSAQPVLQIERNDAPFSVSVKFPTRVNHEYQVQRSLGLDRWEDWGSRSTGTGEEIAVENPSAQAAFGHYRVIEYPVKLPTYEFPDLGLSLRRIPVGSLCISHLPSVSSPLNEQLDLIAEEESRGLSIVSVAGRVVPRPAFGDLRAPDLFFTEEGEISVLVRGRNLPDGTPLQLRITAGGQVIRLPNAGDPDVTLVNGEAEFRTVVPAGPGSLQAMVSLSL